MIEKKSCFSSGIASLQNRAHEMMQEMMVILIGVDWWQYQTHHKEAIDLAKQVMKSQF